MMYFLLKFDSKKVMILRVNFGQIFYQIHTIKEA